MKAFEFPGVYRDARGEESIGWRIQASTRSGWDTRYEIRARIRGIEVWGGDFDVLEPSETIPGAGDVLSLDANGELAECVLMGDLPCEVASGGERRLSAVRFTLDLGHSALADPARPRNLELSILIDGITVTVRDDWFEDGLTRLESQLPKPFQLVCCVTCLYSDYSPGGHGLMGMRCHRGAKAAYLAVKSKADYWKVPVTEDVPETYLCEEYERRVPGTGYRG